MDPIELMFDVLNKKIDDGFTGTHARLDLLNGRVRENEIDIGILKDRSEADDPGLSRTQKIKWSAVSGGAVALLTAIGELLAHFSK